MTIADETFNPEFDQVFRVDPAGYVFDVPGLYAPTVFHDGDADVFVESENWQPLTGFTGQCGYNGAVMHPSEQFGGGLRREVLSTPGIYCLVVVESDEGDEPVGWAVLRFDPSRVSQADLAN